MIQVQYNILNLQTQLDANIAKFYLQSKKYNYNLLKYNQKQQQNQKNQYSSLIYL
ncbi:hypothetical protein pb186bvf_014438 [Paramecium bursaria]